MRWPLIKLLPEKPEIRFVDFARAAGFVSVIAVIASLVALVYPGMQMGIDFKGGTVLEMTTKAPVADLAKARGVLNNLSLGEVQVQSFGSPDHAMVRFQTPEGANAAATVTRVKTALNGALGAVTYPRTEVVGAKVSGELFVKGIQALVLAIVLMMIYIWFRFELQFGIGAVVALFHDVILTFGLIVLFRFEFSLNLVAALLTIIGYSMNDTVVIFDRVRENLRKYKKMPLRELIDLSIQETISRTVITGVTALLALSGLAVFGGDALRGLSIILMFGIVIGTYSSIYVAAPVILLWAGKRGDLRRTEEAPATGVIERP